MSKHFKPEYLEEPLSKEEELVAVAAIAELFYQNKKSEETSELTNLLTPWKLRRLT